jgi:hypothetical protein
MTQSDLFGPRQADLFPAATAAASAVGDPVKVRARIARILGELTKAERLPWDTRTLRLNRTIVPQMSRWLPDEERAELLAGFERELARLGALA